MQINAKGQALVEVLVSLAVAMIVLTALLVTAVTSVRNATFARNQSQANAFAKEAMDSIRAYRDVDPAGFVTISGCRKLVVDVTNPKGFRLDAANGSTPTCTDAANYGDLIPNTTFTRVIAMQNSAGSCPAPSGAPAGFDNNRECVKVTVAVYWTDSTGTHAAQQTSLFGKWQ